MSTNLQDYIELLTAEQHVQVDKLRESARNGISARVRGEVWMYLLGVVSSDKTSEMTNFKALRNAYVALDSSLPPELMSMILRTALNHHTRRFESPTYESLITSLTAEGLGSGGAAGAGAGGGGGGGLGGGGLAYVGGVPQSAILSGVLVGGAGASLPGSRSSSGPGPAGVVGVGAYGVSPILGAASRMAPPALDLGDHPLDRRATFLVPAPTAPPSRHAFLAIMEDVLGKYWHASGCWPDELELEGGCDAPWVYLATPFVCCLTRPVAVFYGFERLMERLQKFPPLPSRIGSMLGLFRLALPELHTYFEDEQVPMMTVAISWMSTLLSREMWLGDVLRLWDSYLASDDMFSLHCHVCVAVLMTCKETLEELDGSEAKLMLLDLPPLDVDRLLQDAANLKVNYVLPRPIADDEW